ncbi:beta-lactamase family protein [Luteimonas sp. SX5]|uniref:Beta-lactamase family protein n=1 Tax=Luteimonas galliterrae TaxID=2940486 RepID=A0ABT0MLE5_9GAMM|nr:serine hydrolase domain-containing protein [Luteimonas galliterrae]MCL1635709.1 beta-lactamase family protein [Luteimonas galliterrae]
MSTLPLAAQDGPDLRPPVTVERPKAQAPVAPADVTDAATGSLTRADLEAWLDGFMPYALERGDVAGSVVVVVKDGRILFQKGYGYADVAARKPVDPQRTLFRPGSVSKLFTWTAVMQLVEQGKLDLDRDVNEYLDFKIPPRDGKPITLRNIMTHTTGMEETARALITSDAKNIPSLGDYLKHWVPVRIFPAGVTPAYSNYATSLAGYIVERVSGEPFDDYLDRHIFAPLGMRHASFRQPLPAALQPLMSKGYELASDDKPKPYEIVTSAPAGALAASGEDMGRFMIAHLQNGAYGSGRILQPATAEQMHGTALTILPPLNRMLLGFYETNINGHRVIAHGGDTQWFHSYLHLFLDRNVGLYVSVNSAGKEGAAGAIRTALFESFADRYLPGPRAEGKVDPETAKQHAQQIAGRYENSRRAETSFISLAYLMGQVKVVANEDGTITVPMLTGLNGQPKKFREIAPYVWRDVAGHDRLAAKVVNGRVERFSTDPFSAFMMFDRTSWWRSAGWLMPLLVVALAALLLTVLAWPVSALVRRHYGVGYRLSGRDAKAHRWIRIASLAVLIVAGAAFAMVLSMLSSFELMTPGYDIVITLLRLLATVVVPLGAAVAVWNAWTVLRSGRRWPAKLWSIVLAVSCLGILWVCVVFRVIGYSANY